MKGTSFLLYDLAAAPHRPPPARTPHPPTPLGPLSRSLSAGSATGAEPASPSSASSAVAPPLRDLGARRRGIPSVLGLTGIAGGDASHSGTQWHSLVIAPAQSQTAV